MLLINEYLNEILWQIRINFAGMQFTSFGRPPAADCTISSEGLGMPDDTSFETPNWVQTRPLLRRTFSREKSADLQGRDLVRYWNSLRDGLAVPRRSDIDPRGISGLLSNTFIIEKMAPGLARFRVAGTDMSDLMGMDLRGMPMSALFLPEARDDLADALEQVFEAPGILRASLASPKGLRRPDLLGDLLVLPLRDDLGQITRAIGCVGVDGEIGAVPRRFEFRTLRVDPVTVVGAPAERSKDQESTLAPTSARENTIRFAPVKPGRPEYLRLVIMD
jgi:hypothetical protein